MAPKSFHRLTSTSAAVLLAAAATLAGCDSIHTTFQDQAVVKVRKEPTVQRVVYSHDINFEPGASVLSSTEARRLDTFVERAGLGVGDQAYVVERKVSGILDDARAQAVQSRLIGAGVRVARLPSAALGVADEPNTVTLVIERTAISLPACPDWTERPNQSFDNQPGSYWGCATAINFGMHVAVPTDLVEGRDPGNADGMVMARSVRRYRLGETKDIIRDAASAEIFPTTGSEDKGAPAEKGE